MDAARVVEVWSPAVGLVGSGYLLSEGLVLTSYHVVPGLERGAPVEVRPLSDRAEAPWLAGRLSWPEQPVDLDAHPERDAALLALDEPHRVGGDVRFGRLGGQGRTPCLGLGFPDAEARPDRRRDTMAVRGHLDALQARRSGLLTVHVDEGIVPRRRAQGSGWAGSSGTALFCGPLLVGVLATDRDVADDASVLGAAPISALAALPGFRETLAAHGVELRMERAAKGERRLASYLAAARNAAVEHPYDGVLPGSAPLLSAVYLRQRVMGSHELAADDTERARPRLIGVGTRKVNYAVEGGTRPAARGGPEPRSAVDAVLADPRTSVILAGPGGGKSSLLRTLLAVGVERWDAGHDATALPVLVHASALADHGLPQGLATAVGAHLRAYGLVEDLPAQFFRTAPRPGARWLVLVDGLDEVTDPTKRRSVLRLIAARMDAHDNPYTFVIASRPLDGADLALLGAKVPRYDLLAFGRTELSEVFTRWFRAHGLPEPEVRARLFGEQLARSSLVELARVPLMTAMLCQLYAASPDGPLPESRGEIYRRFVAMLHQHQYRAGAPQYGGVEGFPGGVGHAEQTLKHLPELIAYLAAQRHAGSTVPAVAIVRSQTEGACPKGTDAGVWDRFLDTALRRSGLLVPRAGDLDFLHPTFEEYLSACHVVATGGVGVLRAVFDHPQRRAPHFLRRYWGPPVADPSDVGFLLDALSDEDWVTAVTLHLRRLIAGGLEGCRYLGTLVQLGTALPAEVLREASAALHAQALDSGHSPHDYQQAVDALADLRDRDTLLALLLDTTVGAGKRALAGAALTELGDRRGADAMDALHASLVGSAETDTVWLRFGRALNTLGDPHGTDILLGLARIYADVSYDNRRIGLDAAHALAQSGDPRAADVFAAQARQTTDPKWRIAALTALAQLGDPRGIARIHRLATRKKSIDVAAATALAQLGDSRAPDLLHTAALDVRLDGADRLAAAVTLGRLGDPRGSSALHALTTSPSIKADYGTHTRSEAAKALAELGDERGVPLLHELATDHLNTLEPARVLAGLGDPRGADLLHAAALSPGHSGEERLEAAKALARLDDPRGADDLHAIALDPTVEPWKRTFTGYGRPPTPRVQAAETLAGLGDRRSVDLLRTLRRTRGTFDRYDRKEARIALRQLRTRPEDRLAWMRTLIPQPVGAPAAGANHRGRPAPPRA
jgi:HEAT repeat protein